MQQVNFDWEFIIADDYSTDGTREILQEYKNKCPDLIQLILQPTNVGASKNWLQLLGAANNKYIAYMEGDDYWTDPLKLQKQVDFLEKNEDYSLVFHKVKALSNNQFIEEDGIESRYLKITDKDKITVIDLLKHNNFIHSCSILFRNSNLVFPFELSHSPVGDYFLFIILAQQGFLYRMDEYMGVYRRGSGNYSSLSRKEMQKKKLQYHMYILSYLSKDEQKLVFLESTLLQFDKYEELFMNERKNKLLGLKKIFNRFLKSTKK